MLSYLKKKGLYLLHLMIFPSILGQNLGTSYPYVTGNTFRSLANFIYDEFSTFNPKDVFDKSIIFVKTDFAAHFFRSFHPKIKNRYLLITHNGCMDISNVCQQYIHEPKLIAWFGQNITVKHPKAVTIPVGFGDKRWEHGQVEVYEPIIKKAANGEFLKKIVCYLNFTIGSFGEPRYMERQQAWNILKNKPFCTISGPKKFKHYLEDLAQSSFVISPRGNGYDCHRVWEALAVGCFPILKRSPLDHLYKDLPVVFVNNWNEVNEELLQKKLNELSRNSYKYEKIFMDYWIEKLNNFLN